MLGMLLYCLSRGYVCLEKCLILQRTIEKIRYKKDVLEVIVWLKDRTIIRVENTFSMKSGKRVVQRREGDVNPAAPACTPSLINNNGAPGRSRTAVAGLGRLCSEFTYRYQDCPN